MQCIAVHRGQVHQPEKPNPLLGVLGDVAFPLLVIAGLLFLRSRSGGGSGIPGHHGVNMERHSVEGSGDVRSKL